MILGNVRQRLRKALNESPLDEAYTQREINDAVLRRARGESAADIVKTWYGVTKPDESTVDRWYRMSPHYKPQKKTTAWAKEKPVYVPPPEERDDDYDPAIGVSIARHVDVDAPLPKSHGPERSDEFRFKGNRFEVRTGKNSGKLNIYDRYLKLPLLDIRDKIPDPAIKDLCAQLNDSNFNTTNTGPAPDGWEWLPSKSRFRVLPQHRLKKDGAEEEEEEDESDPIPVDDLDQMDEPSIEPEPEERKPIDFPFEGNRFKQIKVGDRWQIVDRYKDDELLDSPTRNPKVARALLRALNQSSYNHDNPDTVDIYWNDGEGRFEVTGEEHLQSTPVVTTDAKDKSYMTHIGDDPLSPNGSVVKGDSCTLKFNGEGRVVDFFGAEPFKPFREDFEFRWYDPITDETSYHTIEVKSDGENVIFTHITPSGKENVFAKGYVPRITDIHGHDIPPEGLAAFLEDQPTGDSRRLLDFKIFPNGKIANIEFVDTEGDFFHKTVDYNHIDVNGNLTPHRMSFIFDHTKVYDNLTVKVVRLSDQTEPYTYPPITVENPVPSKTMQMSHLGNIPFGDRDEVTVHGRYGTLTLNKNGNYEYEVYDGIEVPKGEVDFFPYGIRSISGDYDGGTAGIHVSVDDDHYDEDAMKGRYTLEDELEKIEKSNMHPKQKLVAAQRLKSKYNEIFVE